ncbi:hypothetical protein TNCV_2045571 [Trichonephila clavipes]|uniref:Uncharacterized protein n=1 Tax=Trichonephila clavipes TaxID=2585209 RepID=A0A8X6SVH7_TRICX|nr:hypothetical protein TNCV_2045571 [Trichonephila clavipes]
MLHCHQRRYEQLSRVREKNHWDDGSWMVSLASISPPEPFLLYNKEVLGPVDRRDVIYSLTRLRTPSTDRHQDRRMINDTLVEPTIHSPLFTHRQAFTTGHVSSQTITRCLAEGHLVLRRLLHVLSIHPPTPPFGVVSHTMGLDCKGMEPGRLQ